MWRSPEHRHMWRIVGVEHGKAINVHSGRRVVGGDATLVKYRCPICGQCTTERLAGTWTTAQLTGRTR